MERNPLWVDFILFGSVAMVVAALVIAVVNP